MNVTKNVIGKEIAKRVFQTQTMLPLETKKRTAPRHWRTVHDSIRSCERLPE